MRELAIQMFNEKFGDWHKLMPAHLTILEGFLALELEHFNKEGLSLVRDLRLNSRFDASYDDGGLDYARLGVDASYFDNRCAFEFGGWSDTPISIAPWADSFNATPFCNALIHFASIVEQIK